MGQGIQEGTRQSLWKTAFKKFEYLAPNIPENQILYSFFKSNGFQTLAIMSRMNWIALCFEIHKEQM